MNKMPSWMMLILFAAATRLAVLGFGSFAYRHLPPLPWTGVGPLSASDSFTMTFYRWDATFYFDICENGYRYDPKPGQMNSVAFSPLLPVLMDAAKMLGGDPHIAGLVIPNLAFIIGMAFFGKAVALTVDDAGTVWRACALLCAYPTAFFFSCPYQESLGFLAVSFAWWAWLRHRPAASAAGIFVAMFARLTSLAFPAALGLEWLDHKIRGKPARSVISIIIIGLAGCLSVAIYYFYLYYQFGDAMAQMKSQAAWNRKPPALMNVPRTLIYLFYYYPQVGQWHESASACFALLFFTGLGLRAWRVRGTFAGTLILLPILQALLTGTPMSLERLVLASFPAFLDLGELLKRPVYFWSVMALFCNAQSVMLDGYVHFQFVG